METEAILKNIKTIEQLDVQREAFLARVKEADKEFAQKRAELVKAERERKRKEEQDFRDDLANAILRDYKISSREIAVLIVDRAWDEGHSYGYDEVRNHAESLADYTEKVVEIVEDYCY